MTDTLRDVLEREDMDEQFCRIEADERLTCHTHQMWADVVHMERFH